MATPADAYLREQLEARRVRLEAVRGNGNGAGELERLVREVDTALERMGNGTFGICEKCNEPIETERLLADPLMTFCLDHLSPGEQRVLEADLGLAARVQEAMLPKADVRVDGWEVSYHYEAAGMVSGDYCDLIVPQDGGGFFFAVGDVSGKGVAASMMMSHLHAVLRSLAPMGLPIDQLMGRVNTVFCESAMAGYYATLVIGRVGSGGEIELSNAGHCLPLVVRNGGATVLDQSNLPVGLFCKGTYAVQQVKLGAGESLVLYTDGVTEAQGTGETEYGEARLKRAAGSAHGGSAAGLVRACVADMQAFCNGGVRRDDRTLMVIRRA